MCQQKSPTDGAKISLIKTSPGGQKRSELKAPILLSLGERLLCALSLDASGRFKCAISFVNIRRAAADQNTRRRVIRKKRPRNACAAAKQVALISFVFAVRRQIRFPLWPSQPSFLLRESKANSGGLSQSSLCVCQLQIEIKSFQSIFLSVCAGMKQSKNFTKIHCLGSCELNNTIYTKTLFEPTSKINIYQ
jgi:hypothetical protein